MNQSVRGGGGGSGQIKYRGQNAERLSLIHILSDMKADDERRRTATKKVIEYLYL